MSAIWNYFTRLSSDRNKARCDTCKKELACTGGTTTCLSNHLKGKHKDLHKNFENASKPKKCPAPAEDQPKPEPKKTRTIEDCMPPSDDALDKAVTDAIIDFLADSGVAFRVVGLASFEKLMKIANKRIKLKHPVTYSRMIKVKAEEIKKDILAILNAVKEDVSCLGFTTDLWTSGAGEPFMGLTIHLIDKNWHLHR